jgi:hypothetical protein
MMKETIFDPVRKKRVALTPEEGVRQQLISLLSEKYGYPVHLMSCEYAVTINKLKYRGDLVVFDNMAQPVLLAECKAPGVAIKRETFEQILRYNTSLKVKYLLITNGNETYLARYDQNTSRYVYIDMIPKYDELFK